MPLCRSFWLLFYLTIYCNNLMSCHKTMPKKFAFVFTISYSAIESYSTNHKQILPRALPKICVQKMKKKICCLNVKYQNHVNGITSKWVHKGAQFA